MTQGSYSLNLNDDSHSQIRYNPVEEYLLHVENQTVKMSYAPHNEVNRMSAADLEAPLPFSTRTSIFSLHLKTFVYILNIIVVCIGCGCVYGSPAFKDHLRGNSTPQLVWDAKQFKLDSRHTLTLVMNTTCDLCLLEERETFLIELQAVLFGVSGFLSILLVGLSVLLHCSSWNAYSTSFIRKTDPSVFVLGGVLMALMTAAIFYPVNEACHLMTGAFDLTQYKYNKTSEELNGINKTLVEIGKHLCYARWRVDDAIAAFVLGLFTCVMYFFVAGHHMWGLPCAPKLNQIPRNEYQTERNINSRGPPSELSQQPVESPTEFQDIQPQLPPSS